MTKKMKFEKPKRDSRSRGSREAQAVLMRVVMEQQPEMLENLRDQSFELFKALPTTAKEMTWSRIQALGTIKTRIESGTDEEDRRTAKEDARVLAVCHNIDLKALGEFATSLSAWVGLWDMDKFTNSQEWTPHQRETWSLNLHWVFDFALVQFAAWEDGPDALLGERWVELEPKDILGPWPKKFIYTLTIPDEERWRTNWEERELRARYYEGIPADPVNPYAIENTEFYQAEDVQPHTSRHSVLDLNKVVLNKMRVNLGLGDANRAELDWDPRSGESQEAFIARALQDVEKRLRKHLNAKKDEVAEVGFGPIGKLNLERDARWVLQRYADKMPFQEIADDYNAESRGEQQATKVGVEQQIRSFMELLGYTSKKP